MLINMNSNWPPLTGSVMETTVGNTLHKNRCTRKRQARSNTAVYLLRSLFCCLLLRLGHKSEAEVPKPSLCLD